MDSEIQLNVRLMINRLSSRIEQERGIRVEWEKNINDYDDILLKEKEKIKKLRQLRITAYMKIMFSQQPTMKTDTNKLDWIDKSGDVDTHDTSSYQYRIVVTHSNCQLIDQKRLKILLIKDFSQ